MTDNARVQRFKNAVNAGDLPEVVRLKEEPAGGPADEQIDVVRTPDGFVAAMGGKVIVVE
ncbi:hypothetical protein GCM10023195_29520 [Actinoallomurus liliacearum]|uniref:Uncharacterized protein n=1 Tax=Actinoallomurus liliacearum TaxID=1080073 RepID=A0ABP8TK90_9ACTN